MLRWYIGEQFYHHRAHQLGDNGEQAAGFRHFHQTEEERHHANQPQGQRDRSLGRVHHVGGESLHGRDIFRRGRNPADLLPAGEGKSDENDPEKDGVHGRVW